MVAILYRPLCIMHSRWLLLSKASIHGLGAAYHFVSLFHVIFVGVLWRSFCYCFIYHIAVIARRVAAIQILRLTTPSTALWRHRSMSTFVQVMVCCLFHYLNQFKLIAKLNLGDKFQCNSCRKYSIFSQQKASFAQASILACTISYI